jgi:drug/metabolite transporter (DMT)-like permease
VKTTALAMMYTTWLFFSAWRSFTTGGWEAVAGLWLGWQNLTAWALLIYSAIGPGAVADVLQQNGQKEVSASEANVILCSEPIFTAALAFLIAGETTTATENAGGALVVLAAILASSSSNNGEV